MDSTAALVDILLLSHSMQNIHRKMGGHFYSAKCTIIKGSLPLRFPVQMFRSFKRPFDGDSTRASILR